MYKKPKEKPKSKPIQGTLFNWLKKDDIIVEKKDNSLKKTSSLMSFASFLKPSSSKSNTVDSIVQNSSVNNYDDVEIVTAGQTTLTREEKQSRRSSQLETIEYPPSKKSVDGKTLYQRSLSRPTDQSTRAITPDPDETLINAFKQLSSPSAQRVKDFPPQYAAEDRCASPTPQSTSTSVQIFADRFFPKEKETEIRAADEVDVNDDDAYFNLNLGKKFKSENDVPPAAAPYFPPPPPVATPAVVESPILFTLPPKGWKANDAAYLAGVPYQVFKIADEPANSCLEPAPVFATNGDATHLYFQIASVAAVEASFTEKKRAEYKELVATRFERALTDIGMEKRTFRRYRNYYQLLRDFSRFKHCSISFTTVRDISVAIRNWFNSEECIALPVTDTTSASFWRKTN